MQVSAEGLVRVTLDKLLSTPLRHCFSGVDGGEPDPIAACGRSTTISGYTEWASADALGPASIGWDWQLLPQGDAVRWIRTGLPRTNVQIVSSHGEDLAWQQCLEALATVVDALSWQPSVRAATFASA